MASYDEAKLTSTLRGSFSTFNPTTGANQNADSLPTGLVYKLSDGTTLAATVTISNITTGRYRYSVDVTAGNGFAAGEYYELWISAATTGDSTVTQSVPVCGFKAVTADIDTASAYIDTEVAAIKAKTDNLPSDPADQSLVEAAITAGVASLATAASITALKAVADKIATVIYGTVTGAGTSTEVFVSAGYTITVTADANGNRSSVVIT